MWKQDPNKKVEWLVTVQGYSTLYAPTQMAETITVFLDKYETPIDWFKSKPSTYSGFEYGPVGLINFWKV